MYDSYLALGDSFTEGLDDVQPDGSYRGWADLVAYELARATPGFRYANLAVRGRRLARIAAEQVPPAEEMRPALTSIAGGGNDIIGLRCDVGVLARSMHEVLERLVRVSGTVVVFAGFDPRGRLPGGRVLAGRAGPYNAAVTRSADELGARVVDLWRMPGLEQAQMWAPDRLHLSADGHALVAAQVLRTLGLAPAAAAVAARQAEGRQPWISARREDAVWARRHFAPWVGRRLRGRSTGDFVAPKRPELAPVQGPRATWGTAAASLEP